MLRMVIVSFLILLNMSSSWATKVVDLKQNGVVQVDLNADGTEETLIVSTTTESLILIVGDSRVSFVFDQEWGGSLCKLQLINIDESNKSKQIYAQNCDDYNDPKSIVVAFDGKSLKSNTLPWITSFPGDGTFLQKSGGCGQEHTTTYRLKGNKVTKISTKTKGTFNEDECVACPFVYIDGKYKGEILRYLNHPSLEKTQSLPLGRRFNSTSFTVTISEEKPEITHLNAIWIVQNGQKILPKQCDTKQPEFCSIDRNYYRMERGDSIELDFELLDANSPVELWGHGYYVPVYEK
jgi:hypothetical protein